jgi:hypothetical protein
MTTVAPVEIRREHLSFVGEPSKAPGRARWRENLARLVGMSEKELATHDIAQLNLFCAAGLPGTQRINPDACIAKLDDWAKYIDRNIKHWWPDFLRSPKEGEDSPGKFCMLAVASLLQRQLGIHYNLAFSEGDYDGRDSRNLFVHGLLSGYGGTCVSLPVLYIAIGRRLGYPLFLVLSKEHCFARWDDPRGERFNIECAVRGFASHSDEHYRTWREYITDAEVQNGVFLRNLTRREEVAHFLNERGHCLVDHLRLGEALEAYYHAHQMAPHDACIRGAWIVASIMHRTLEQAMRNADRKGISQISISDMRYPDAHDFAEVWAIPHAREAFARIMRIQSSPATVEQPKWRRKPRRGEPDYHKV